MRAEADPTPARAEARVAGSGALLGATVFLSALLLFQVQPIIGKYILPWFGSTPGVWATSLLFFQLMLLVGYAYAHATTSRLSWRRQAVVHALLLGLTLAALPITPADALKPTDADAPVLRILGVLTVSVGAPFVLLSATAPLVQRWFALLHPGRSPYRLYALSNLGSLLALLSYPFLVEPFVRLRAQTSLWSLAYVGFAGLCAGSALLVYRWQRSGSGAASTDGAPDPGRPEAGSALLWLLLSACGSGLLLATTNQMSTDIAVVPFLWVLPLSVYLLTFILAFDHPRWYARPLFVALLPLALMNAVRLLYGGIHLGIVDQVVGYSLTLFVLCMCCHGELSRARPEPRHLTLFFLVVSLGGVLGGAFVAIVAPTLFPSLYEYHLLLIACYALMAFVLVGAFLHGGLAPRGDGLGRTLTRAGWAVALASIVAGALFSLRTGTWLEDPAPEQLAAFGAWRVYMAVYGAVMAAFVLGTLEVWRRAEGAAVRAWWTSTRGLARLGLAGSATAGLVSLTGGLVWQIGDDHRRAVELDRNFYGALAVLEVDADDWRHRLSLTHGRILHGSQLRFYPGWPTTYYGPYTGVGLAIRHHPRRDDPSGQFRIGAVGLGVGTLAAYANARIAAEEEDDAYVTPAEPEVPDHIAFYELNPLVARWAEDRFTFLGDAEERGAEVTVFEGDARVVLDGQLRRGEVQRFDVLVIDAFSSDAIPIHLLTLESVRTYLAHLEEGGILALHVSNRYVDLLPVVMRLADETGQSAVYVATPRDPGRVVEPSEWVLLTRNQAFLDLGVVQESRRPTPPPGPLWTDDFSSLFSSLRPRSERPPPAPENEKR